MYKIVLWNVGMNSTTKDFIVAADSLSHAESVAVEACEDVAGVKGISFGYLPDHEYIVKHNGFEIGSFTLTNLN